MRLRPTMEVMTLDRSREAAALRFANDVNHVAVDKLIDENLVADIRALIGSLKPKLLQYSSRRNTSARLLKMAPHRLRHVLQLHRAFFDQSNLHRVVTVFSAGGFFLHDDTRSGFNDRHRSDCAICRKDLSHA